MKPRSGKTPAQLGYRWPAEWEIHRATWLSWPRNHETWPGRFEEACRDFTQMVRVLADFETVMLLAGGADILATATKAVGSVPNVQIVDIPTNDAWCRDHGPMFLRAADGQPPALVDWEYNAWGNKYPPFDDDNRVPHRIAELFEYERFGADLVLEGGAIDTDGEGTVLAAGSCLLNPNRNPGRTRSEVEQLLSSFLGMTRTIWLARGELVGDDTDGHVDQLARFVAPTRLVVAEETDTHDANYSPLQENLRQLRSLTDHRGRSLEVISLPVPAPLFAGDQRLPASYCNFYIANGLVLVPQYHDDADDRATGIMRELFPNRKVVGFDASNIVRGLGSIHCLTQQEAEG
jgi:agmatine deiminase